MSFVGIQATVDFYTQQEADLTNQLTDIMTNITQASRETTDLVKETSDKKDAVRNNYDSDSPEYDEAMDEVQDDYELKLAEITEWESELETKKNNLETQVKEATSYKESFQSALKSNVQSDFKFAQN